MFRNLLHGRGPDGRTLVGPELRTDPRGLVDARPLIAAVRAVEAVITLSGPTAQALERLARRADRGPLTSVTLRADHVLAIGAAAGVDARPVYADAGLALDEALAHVDERVDVRRPGYDVVFSAPKSVSVIYGLADPQVADQVRDAHSQAISQAMSYLELFVARGAPELPRRRRPLHPTVRQTAIRRIPLGLRQTTPRRRHRLRRRFPPSQPVGRRSL